MVLTATNIQFCLSTGRIGLDATNNVRNNDPTKSLGGRPAFADVIADNTINNLFQTVSGDESINGSVKYRCIYVINTSSTDSLRSPILSATHNTDSPDDEISFGFGRTGQHFYDPSTNRLKDWGGRVMKKSTVWLIFWGNEWRTTFQRTSTTPTDTSPPDVKKTTIEAATKDLLASGYFGPLAQWRNIERPVYGDSLIYTDRPVPKITVQNDFFKVITDVFNTGRIPDPSKDNTVLPVVVTPPGSKFSVAAFSGFHSFFTYKNVRAPYIWIPGVPNLIDPNTTVPGVPGVAVRTLAHEIVEALTDPDTLYSSPAGNLGIAEPRLTTTGPHKGGYQEVADLCENTGFGGTILPGNWFVPAYWSDTSRSCIFIVGNNIVTPAVEQVIANENTAPTGVSFRFAPNVSIMGDLAPRHAQAIWLRRNVNPNASARTANKFTLHIQGTT